MAYVPDDLGDNGVEEMAKVTSGESIILGMLCYDENKITDLTTDYDLVSGDALLDSLWCIVVDSSDINFTGIDYTADNVTSITNDYLRFMACEALGLDVEKVAPVAE